MRMRLGFLLIGFLMIHPASGETTRVGILVFSGVYNTEFVAPYDVFQHADRPQHPVQVFLVSPRETVIRSAEGLEVKVDYTFENHPEIDILIVPSFEDYESDLKSRPEVIDWIQKTARRARFVLSNCWGAFYLAKAGLLDGRYAMTYPPDIDKLARSFPKIKTIKGKRFVEDGKFITGGGGVASYENAFYVVEKLWGSKLARRIASGLVTKWDLEAMASYHASKPRQ